MGKLHTSRLVFVSLNLATMLSLSSCVINLPILGPEPEDGPSSTPNVPGTQPGTQPGVQTGTQPSFDAPPLQPNFLGEPSLAVEDGAMAVSGEFTLAFPGPGNHLVSVPVAQSALRSAGKGRFVLERNLNGSWETWGHPIGYDEAAGTATFDLRAPESFNTAQTGSGRYRIRFFTFSSAIEVTRPGSKFRIYYYNGLTNPKSTVKLDQMWNSGSGQASDPSVPDFVEDLDAALNEVYPKLLAISKSDGQPLFRPHEGLMDIYITDTGESAGYSPLNGPVSISNTKMRDFQDMKNVGAHELTHLLSGQYYSLSGLFTTGKNRAFLEALAQYLSAEANGLSPAQRKDFYGENSSEYLSVPINVNNDNSMYGAGHFLDFVGSQYGRATVADALAQAGSNEYSALSAAISTKSGSGGLGTAFREYGQHLISKPEDMAGFNLAQISKMGGFSTSKRFLKERFLRDFRLYTRYTQKLPPLSMGYASIQASISFPGLLVVNGSPVSGLVDSKSYATAGGGSNSSYHAPLEDSGNLFSGQGLSVEGFGSYGDGPYLEQLLINYSQNAEAQVDVQYYLLAQQDVSGIEDGKVSWDTVRMAGIPADVIRGFRVYANGSQVEGSDIVSYSGSSIQSLSSPLIHPGDTVQVSVVDVKGNQWPPAPKGKVETGEPELIFSHNANDVSLYFPNSTEDFEAEVRGLSNKAVHWELIAGDFNGGEPLGSLDVNGGKARYTAPSTDTSACVRASSVARPDLVKQFCFNVSTSISTECVLPETAVTLVTGQKRAIQDLHQGDRILAWDPLAKRVTPANIDRVYRHADKDYPVSKLATASGQDLTLTGNHPVATPSGWRKAETLAAGDTIYLVDPRTGLQRETRILSIIAETRPAKVLYNLKTSMGNYIANDVLVHNKCLAGQALIETPDGMRRADQLAVGDRVWGLIGGERHPVRITAQYRKQTVLEALPGKRLSPQLILTVNHRLQRGGVWIPAGDTNYAAQPISGPVYDFETESGNLLSEGFLLEAGQAQRVTKSEMAAAARS